MVSNNKAPQEIEKIQNSINDYKYYQAKNNDKYLKNNRIEKSLEEELFPHIRQDIYNKQKQEYKTLDEILSWIEQKKIDKKQHFEKIWLLHEDENQFEILLNESTSELRSSNYAQNLINNKEKRDFFIRSLHYSNSPKNKTLEKIFTYNIQVVDFFDRYCKK